MPVLGFDRFDLFPTKIDLSPLQSQYLTAPHTSVERNPKDRPEVTRLYRQALSIDVLPRLLIDSG